MDRHSRLISATLLAVLLPALAPAQDLPAEYQAVLTSLNKKGDFKDGVFKVNIPRSDLTVKIGNRAAPTPFGFGGWVAMTPGDGMQVMMGDLVLTEDEVNPVMSAILDNGLSVTALHNHFFWEQPRIFYMHVHGMGSAADLARKLKPAIALIDAAAARATSPAAPAAGAPAAGVTGATVAKIIGHQGEQTGPVYKITIGRPDIDLREHGAKINARMGLNTWAAFAGSDADAMVAGDVAMLEAEVQPVLKTLRAHGLDIVAIHHHMTDVKPVVIFLHYYGTGPATKLAEGVRAAVDLLGKPRPAGLDATAAVGTSGQRSGAPSQTGKVPTVLFMCPHGAAKSVLASAYFQRLAKERGLNVRVESAGTEPDAEVSSAVAAHLVKNGYPNPVAKPRKVTASDLATADVVISMGCDLKGLPAPRGRLLKWDEVPGPGEHFAAADAAIRKRVLELVDELMRQPRAR
jgi:protein-tyrosine-phosphatase